MLTNSPVDLRKNLTRFQRTSLSDALDEIVCKANGGAATDESNTTAGPMQPKK
jgi:hypothetical protein